MILWIFALLDILVVTSMTLAHFDILFSQILLGISSLYLIGKGVAFFGDKSAIIELVFGIYIALMAIFNFSTFLYYIVILWIGSKIVTTIVNQT